MMENIFLNWLRKDKFIFGVVISFVSSVVIVLTALNYAEIIKKELLYLPITAGLFMLLFMWYVKIMEKNGSSKRAK